VLAWLLCLRASTLFLTTPTHVYYERNCDENRNTANQLVCNPNQEAWKWKHVKRKTDRDDALKLAKLAALGQLVPVYIPSQPQREYRRLVKYRQVLIHVSRVPLDREK